MIRHLTSTFFACAIAVLLCPVCKGQSIEIVVPAFANPCCETENDQGISMWTDLIQTSDEIGAELNVIFNPNSGTGGELVDANYVPENYTSPAPLYPETGSAPLVELRDGGADVFGYIATGFGPPGNADPASDGTPNPGRLRQDVEDEIDIYFQASYYRGAGVQVNAIFLDEMSYQISNLQHYQMIYEHIKDEHGDVQVIANPGQSVSETFLSDPNGPVADTVVIFEGTPATYETWTPESWVTSGNYDRSHFAIIIHGEATAAQMLTYVARAHDQNAGMIFIGDDPGIDGNDYGQWPEYWQEEVDATINVGAPIETETIIAGGDQQRSMLTIMKFLLT